MENLVLFTNAFLSYLLVFVLIVVLVIVACVIGVKLRKNKNGKEFMPMGSETGKNITQK